MVIKKAVTTAVILLILPLPLFFYGMENENSSNLRSMNYAEKHVVINEVCYNPDSAGGSWFEIYNPTDISFNTSGWLVWFRSIYGPIPMPTLVIHPHEYVIVCWNGTKNSMIKYWNINPKVKIIGLSGWGSQWDIIYITNGVFGPYYDGVGEPLRPHVHKLPAISLDHSWARYKGGYDTDNFTNDFYDEPNPTPGYENHRAKQGGENNENVIYWIIAIGVVAIVAAVSICAWRWKGKFE